MNNDKSEKRKTLAAIVAEIREYGSRPPPRLMWLEIADRIEAISAPKRNCDIKECSSYDGMISAHERFCESWHDDGKTCAECPYNPRSPMITCREKWLLAPAAGKEARSDTL